MPLAICPSSEELEAFATGELLSPRFEEIVEHLETCPRCQADLAALKLSNDPLQEILAQPPVKSPFEDETAYERQAALVAAPWDGRPTLTPAQPPAQATQAGTEQPPAITQAGRYHLEECIGEGGMGIVFRAHDPDFRRPLAVKVLKEKYKDRPDMVARFLKEAQITGQLQHPGVPPVHEIGRLSDGRPFLAMKLIEGRNLLDLLRERPDPHHDLPRFLTLFEHVCQTLAYALSRRVIHRDLKPENIMVGAFGEVQVMDWGLAKVLSGASPESSDTAAASTMNALHTDTVVGLSRKGDVIGTLRYMPPEQACGEIDRLDERSDVFGLGAILCVILTGEPPYRADSLEELFEQARNADLRDAFARLDSCQADAELVALAKHCLAKDQTDRPRDAAAVAETVAAYQASVQERLRRAELERAAAEAKAREERKRRWLAVGSVLIVLLVVGGGFLATYLQYRQTVEEKNRSDRLVTEKSELLVKAQKRNALSALDTAQRHFGDHEGNLGLLWLGRALEDAPANDRDLQRVVRANLTAWVERAHRLTDVLPHASGAVLDLALSPDGRTVATASGNSGRLWDLATGTVRGPSLDHADLVRSIAFSPDGELVVTAGGDGVAQMWNVANGTRHGPPLRHTDVVQGAVFSPKGQTVLTWSNDHTARFWDLATGNSADPPLRHDGPVFHAAFSGDGLVVLTLSSDKTARLWSVERKHCLHNWRHPAGFSAGAFCTDHRSLLLASGNNTLEMYALDGSLLWKASSAHQGSITTVAFSPGGESIVSASADATARIWDARTGKPRFPEFGHNGLVRAASFDPQGRVLVTCSQDNTARIWDVDTASPLGLPLYHEGWVRAAVFARDGQTLLTASRDSKVRLWRPTLFRAETVRLSHDAKVWASAFHPDGTRILTAWGEPCAAGTSQFWDLRNGQRSGPTFAHDSTVFALAMSQDGRRFASTSADGTAQVWDCETGSSIGSRLVHKGYVTSVAFHPNGKQVLTGSLDYTAQLWEWESGKKIRTLPHSSDVWAVAISWSGRTAATGCGDRRAYLWALDNKDSGPMPLEHQGRVLAVAFGHNDRFVATGSADKTARLWDTRSGDQICSLKHPEIVQSIALAPDGRTLATGCHDGFARLWDVATERLIGPPLAINARSFSDPPSVNKIWTVSFSSDGTQFLSGGEDKTASVWPVPVPDCDSVRDILLRLQVITGLELDTAGAPCELDLEDWRAKRQFLSRDQ
jgi:WD40 repeat protein/tRNA A-37 threonylcarbamoyl transferase component Bud32